MTRTFAMTMQRPHEALRLPQPMGRRLSEVGRKAWVTAIITVVVACVGVYIYQVNRAAQRGFDLQTLQIKAERLQEQVASLEGQIAQQQSLHSLQEQVKTMGYVSVDRMEFPDPAKNAYALAK